MQRKMGLKNYMPTIVLIACQFLYSAVILTGREALLQDMSPRVFVVYRQFIAFLLIAPLAFFSRKGTNGCLLGWKNFWLIFLLSFIGVTIYQNMYFEGLYLASSSAGSALGNLAPAITFIMAYSLGFSRRTRIFRHRHVVSRREKQRKRERLEKVDVRSLRSVAKIIGTVFCVGGAVLMALLKGPKLLNMEFQSRNSLFLQSGGDTWLVGCLFLFGSACCWSIWLILQAHVSVSYDNHLSLTAWMCLTAAIQSAILTLIFEPNLKAWKMDTSLEIFSCFLAGLVSAITFFAQAWCIAKRGPLFSAMFNPLSTVIVTVLACIFLREELYIGSFMGALAVVIGLYIVLWGKAKDHEEMKEDTTICNQFSSDNISCNIDLEEPFLSENYAK